MGNGLAIMLVEDDKDHADLFQLCLETTNIKDLTLSLHHCHTITEAQEGLTRPEVRVVFLDYKLGMDSGLEFLIQMRRCGDRRPVVVLTGQGNEYVAVDMMRAGADEYIVKSDLDATVLEKVLRRCLIQEEHARQLQSRNTQIIERIETLTPRESEVLELIIEGKTNKDIGNILHRSENTVKIHRARVMRKLQANSATDLVRMILSTRTPVDQKISEK